MRTHRRQVQRHSRPANGHAHYTRNRCCEGRKDLDFATTRQQVPFSLGINGLAEAAAVGPASCFSFFGEFADREEIDLIAKRAGDADGRASPRTWQAAALIVARSRAQPELRCLVTTIPDDLNATVGLPSTSAPQSSIRIFAISGSRLSSSVRSCATLMSYERADCGPSMARRPSSTSCAR